MTMQRGWRQLSTTDCSSWPGDPEGTPQRGLLSAIRMLEKLSLIAPIDLGRHWMQVEGIRRISAPNATPRVFAETADLEHLSKAILAGTLPSQAWTVLATTNVRNVALSQGVTDHQVLPISAYPSWCAAFASILQ